MERALFPAPATGVPALWQRALTAVVFLAAIPLVALRMPLRSWNSLWAEDGVVFLQEALSDGPWQPFGTQYAGYLHAYPRLASLIVTGLPLSWAGVLYTFLASAVVVWVAWTVWSSGTGLLPSPWIRGILCTAVVLLPAGGLEALANVANGHFFLMFGAFWALLGRTRSWGGLLSAHALVVLACLSDPVTLIALPVAAARIVLLRRWRERLVSVTFAVSMAVQLLVVATAERETGGGLPSLPELAFGYSLRVVSTSAVGLAHTKEFTEDGAVGEIRYVAAGVVLLLLVGLAVARRNRLVAVATLIASLTFFTVASAFSLGGSYPPGEPFRLVLELTSRYTVVPALLLLTTWCLLAQGLLGRLRPLARPALVALTAAPVLVFGVTDFRPDDGTRESGPADWSTHVESLERACDRQPGSEPVTIPIQPPTTWAVTITCSDVD
jgi:hypothetical protein